MKGRISKTLESILLDPAARRQLREHLIHGRDGWVNMNGKTYRVQIDSPGGLWEQSATSSLDPVDYKVRIAALYAFAEVCMRPRTR